VGSATDVTRFTLSANLSSYFGDDSLCAGASAEARAAAKAAAANATLSFVGMMGFGDDTTVKYGASAAVYVPKDAFKFNLQASNWWAAPRAQAAGWLAAHASVCHQPLPLVDPSAELPSTAQRSPATPICTQALLQHGERPGGGA
jgi:hypothetical protein